MIEYGGGFVDSYLWNWVQSWVANTPEPSLWRPVDWLPSMSVKYVISPSLEVISRLIDKIWIDWNINIVFNDLSRKSPNRGMKPCHKLSPLKFLRPHKSFPYKIRKPLLEVTWISIWVELKLISHLPMSFNMNPWSSRIYLPSESGRIRPSMNINETIFINCYRVPSWTPAWISKINSCIWHISNVWIVEFAVCEINSENENVGIGVWIICTILFKYKVYLILDIIGTVISGTWRTTSAHNLRAKKIWIIHYVGPYLWIIWFLSKLPISTSWWRSIPPFIRIINC